MQTRLARALTALIAAVALALTGLAVAPAQAATGTITGLVKSKIGSTVAIYPNAGISLDPVGGGTSLHENTDGTGRYTFTGVPDGQYEMRIFPQNYGAPGDLGFEYYDNAWSYSEATTITVAGNTVSLNDVVLEQPGWVTGKLTDQNGDPLANTYVHLSVGQLGKYAGYKTDANGNYDTRTSTDAYDKNVIPGTYRVSSSGNTDDYSYDARVFSESSQNVTITPNAGSVVNLQVEELKTTVFTLLDTDGTPLVRSPIEMLIQRTPGGPFEPPQYGPIETNDEGQFRVVEGSQYKLRFKTPDGYTGTGVAEWWDGPTGTGAASVDDAAVVDWPTSAPMRREYTVRLDTPVDPVDPVEIAAGTPRITGTAKSGATLTATLGTWGPDGVATTQQWLAGGAPIAGAMGTTLKLTNALAGKRISLQVTGTLDGAETVARTSTATAPVVGTFSSATPKITGKTKVGKRLTAKPGAWSPKPTFRYQWLRNGKAIKGATKASYKLTQKDRGTKISVRLVARKTHYASVTVTSKRTSKIKR